MYIESQDLTIAGLFEEYKILRIPPYQRNYAWEAAQVTEFMSDLSHCVHDEKRHHFFGGIVSVEITSNGPERKYYDIVDGQQRITSFIILLSVIRDFYQGFKDESRNLGNSKNVEFCNTRIELIHKSYFYHKVKERNTRKHLDIRRFQVSKYNDQFFFNLITDAKPDIKKNSSFKKMKEAKELIINTLNEELDKLKSIDDKLNHLSNYESILEENCLLLHIVTKSKEDAYRLFKVLNDRGTNLSDGDLIKATTLELLEHNNSFKSYQNVLEEYWFDILEDPSNKTEDYLRWIYSSYKGKRPGKFTLHDDLVDVFFANNKNPAQEEKEAKEITNIVKEKILNNVILCRQFEEADWPMPDVSNITIWHKNRLNMLINVLGNKASFPLLIAATKLKAKTFFTLINLLERFFFRYKIICNGHPSPLTSIYNNEAYKIHQNPNNYNLNNLKKTLKDLIKKSANDNTFKSLLPEKMFYRVSGEGSNKYLKYFLLTIDYYIVWFDKGALKMPKPSGTNQVYSFKSEIEHIYPRQPKVAILELNKYVHQLGNLSFFDSNDNSTAGNDSFSIKKDIYKDSKVVMTKELSKLKNWDLKNYKKREKRMLDIALKVFTV